MNLCDPCCENILSLIRGILESDCPNAIKVPAALILIDTLTDDWLASETEEDVQWASREARKLPVVGSTTVAGALRVSTENQPPIATSTTGPTKLTGVVTKVYAPEED